MTSDTDSGLFFFCENAIFPFFFSVISSIESSYHNHHVSVPMLQRLETTLMSGAVPQAPQFIPISATASPVTSVTTSTLTKAAVNEQTTTKSVDSKTSTKTSEKGNAESAAAKSVKQPEVGDPLGEARSRVQDEITKEFAAIMATGTLRASEAAALATRRVMERHGRLNASVQQG